MGKISQDLDTFRMPVDLKIETEGNPEEKRVEVVGTSSEFSVDTFGKPKNIVIDPNNRVLRFSNQMRVAVAIRRGEQFAEMSEFGEALKEYQKALETARNSSLAHYRIAEVFFLQKNYQSAANEFREALNGDLEPKWTEVWSHINLGKIFDITGPASAPSTNTSRRCAPRTTRKAHRKKPPSTSRRRTNGCGAPNSKKINLPNLKAGRSRKRAIPAFFCALPTTPFEQYHFSTF